MGVVENVGFAIFPRQGTLLGRRVSVCFHYDAHHRVLGTCVRDDEEAPYETIFQLDDGRYVRAVECQWSYRKGVEDDPPPNN